MKSESFEVVRDSDGVVTDARALYDDAIDVATIREADEGTAYRVQRAEDEGHVELTLRISAEHWADLQEAMSDTGASARLVLERAIDAYVVATTDDARAPWETDPEGARERQEAGGFREIFPELAGRVH